jgi:hypothetical protein
MAEYLERETAVMRLMQDGCSAKNVQSIMELPAADVAPVRHGRWITWEEAGNDIPSPHRHECSVCHDAAQVLVNGFELLSDYCPNCCAKMDGAE